MRLEPAMTSGPTSATIAKCAVFSSGEPALQVTAMVLAPRRRACSTAASGEGSASAGGDSNYHIVLARFFLGHLTPAEFAGVLAGFGGAVQRFDSAGDNELHSLWIGVEGGWALGSVERAETPAGSRANVDEAASSLKRFCDLVNSASDLRQGGLHGGGNFGVLGIDDAGDFQGGLQVEIPGGRVGLLGGEMAESRGGLAGWSCQRFVSMGRALHFSGSTRFGHK